MTAVVAGIGRARNRKIAATRLAYARAELAHDVHGLDRLVTQNLRFTIGYYARAWGLMVAPTRAALRQTVEALGDGALRDEMRAGRGVVLVTVHLGDFDLAGHWVAQALGRRLVVATARVHPAWRGRLYDHMRHIVGFRIRRLGRTSLGALAEDLHNGEIVLVMADRRPGGRGVAVPFLGQPATLSRAPTLLSAATGAAIISAATVTSGRRRLLLFGSPCWASAADDHAWAPAVMAELERAIRSAPHQWHVPAQQAQLPWDRVASPARIDVMRR